MQVQSRHHVAEKIIIQDKAVELVSVNGEMANAFIDPVILLVDAHAHQVRHDVGQALVMVALDPYHFDFAFGIGQLANASQKFPVFLIQASEIEIGEDVSQQDQAAKGILLQHVAGVPSATQLGPEMQIGEDEGVVDRKTHHSCL